jgi:hypothetical protein
MLDWFDFLEESKPMKNIWFDFYNIFSYENQATD